MTYITLLVSLFALVTPAEVPNGTLPVTVRAIVRTEDGAPMADVPLSLTTGKQNGYGLTDKAGVLELTLQADDQSFSLATARLWRHFRREDLQPMRGMALKRYDELIKQYFFQPIYVAKATPRDSNLEIQVTAFPSIELSATVDVVPFPSQESAFVWVANGVYTDVVKVREPVRIPGVRKGHAAELLWVLEGGELAWTPVTAAQASTGDLGSITVKRHVADATLRMTVTNRKGLVDESLIPIDDSVFLVRSDAQVAYAFTVDQNDLVIGGVHAGKPTHDVHLASGSYYVIPGSPGGAMENKLRAILLAGKPALLDAAGVPTIKAEPVQTRTLEVNAATALSAIKSIDWP